MYFEQILQTFYGTHWAILPERLHEMESVLLKLIADRFTGQTALKDCDPPGASTLPEASRSSFSMISSESSFGAYGMSVMSTQSPLPASRNFFCSSR